MENSLVIDTDAGADDLMAIAYLLSIPDITIEAITVVRGLCTVEKGTQNLIRILDLIGRRDIPVLSGEPVPIEGCHCFPAYWTEVTDELHGVFLPELIAQEHFPPNPSESCSYCSWHFEQRESYSVASRYLFHRMYHNSSPFRILALGPLTNIARSLQLHKNIELNAPSNTQDSIENSLAQIVIMGGAFFTNGNLLSTMSLRPEWNIYCDPIAASLLIKYIQDPSNHIDQKAIPMVFIGLDVTNEIPIDNEFVQHFNSMEQYMNAAGRFVGDILRSHAEFINKGMMFAWDMLAAVYLVHPDCISTKRAIISVDCDGVDAGATNFITWDDTSEIHIAVEGSKDVFYREFFSNFIVQPEGEIT